MATLSLLSPDDERWRAFATEHATSPLQHPAWLDTLTGAYGLSAQVEALTDSQGALLAALPLIRSKLPWRNRWTSLPFTDYAEPVAVDDARRDELLLAIANDPDSPAIIVRTNCDVPGWFSKQVGTVQTVDLSDGLDGVLRRANKKTRQNVKIGRRPENGLTAAPISSKNEFLGAHLALIADSRHRVGAPTQPRRYWARLWEMHERHEALTIGVYASGEITASAVFLIGRNHAVAKYSASTAATVRRRTNYLALATAVDHLAQLGVQAMDFGVSDLHNESLREFKTRWGGEERPAYFSATRADLLPDTIEPGRLLTRTIQSTPVFVGRSLGALAYPFAG
ncbi:MAG TPA: GNAT family N-acetyltransferase [Solirubrobacteraceae bacterium]|nr:GNAT family N-acetyltransferase [Solirubrobacteraceae bacterium]